MRNNLKTILATAVMTLLTPLAIGAQNSVDNLGTFPMWNKKHAESHAAHITDKTRIIIVKNYARIKPVYDGVFSVEENGLLSFYQATDAQCISKWELRSVNGDKGSHFSGNVAMAVSKEKKGNRNPFVILHRDGTMKQLHPEWTSATNFADGMARVAMTDQSYLSHSFFIDENGNKILPQYNYDQQKKGYANATVTEVKPLSEGLRPFYSRNDKSWGYLDAKGNTVIKPQFSSARGFSEGYAAVTRLDEKRNGKVQFIDKSGKVTFDTGITCYSLDSEERIGDVKGGLIRVWEKGSTATSYYSPDGKLQKTFSGFKGTDAVNGHIFLRAESSLGDMFMLDTKFKPLRAIKVDPQEYWELPKFNDSGLALVDSKTVINSDGDVVLTSGEAIQSLCEDGYIINYFDVGSNEYTGITNINGECVALLVSENKRGYFNHLKEAGEKPKETEGPKPKAPEPKDPEQKEPEHQTVGTDQEYEKFHVSVVCIPNEGGTATGAGEYEYGAKAHITATANKGYKVSTMINSANSRTRSGAENDFEVRDTMTIYVSFVKEDKQIDPPATGALIGQFKWTYYSKQVKMSLQDPIDLYMELSPKPDISTPYGNRYGFLQIQFDTDKRYKTSDSYVENAEGNYDKVSATAESNFYYAPYEIIGFIEDGGKKWMIIDGGAVRWGAMRIGNRETDAKASRSNPLYPLQSLVATLSGYDPLPLEKNALRVEITNVAADGSITLGKMQWFSAEFGWLDKLDKNKYSVYMKIPMFLSVVRDNNMPNDIFDGVVMKPAGKREIEWSTPKSWFTTLSDIVGKSAKETPSAAYERIKKKNMERYKKYKSVYTKFWENKQ